MAIIMPGAGFQYVQYDSGVDGKDAFYYMSSVATRVGDTMRMTGGGVMLMWVKKGWSEEEGHRLGFLNYNTTADQADHGKAEVDYDMMYSAHDVIVASTRSTTKILMHGSSLGGTNAMLLMALMGDSIEGISLIALGVTRGWRTPLEQTCAPSRG